ncbi:MAG: hypothetical protein R3E84_09995 [Pseudomonadales bacterium]
MACCALALVVLTNLLAPLVWLSRRLFGCSPPWVDRLLDGFRARAHGAFPLRQRGRFLPVVLIVVAVEVVLVAAAWQAFAPPAELTDAALWAEAMHNSWCSAIGLR